MTRTFLKSAALLLASAAMPMAHAAPTGLQAGAARVDITPPASSLPIANPGEPPFAAIHDPGFVRALVLDDGRQRLVIVSAEVTAIPFAGDLVGDAARAGGVAPDHVLMVPTHTHSVPLFAWHGGTPDAPRAAEIARLRAAIRTGVTQAVAALSPARAEAGQGASPVNINNGEASRSTAGFDPAGAADHRLDVVRLSGMDGKPIALLLAFPSHAEVMFRSRPSQDAYAVTGDLPGAAARLLEAQAKAAPVVLPMPGAEGDQLPLFIARRHDGEIPEEDRGSAGWHLLDAQARIVGEATMLALHHARPLGTRLAGGTADASCPGVVREIDHATHKVLSEQDVTVKIPLSLLRIGDYAIAGIGGDLASELGARLRADLGSDRTMLTTMRAGSVGYVLDDAAYARETHGVLGSPLRPGCAGPAIAAGLNALDGALSAKP